jgi:hypothetical protein
MKMTIRILGGTMLLAVLLLISNDALGGRFGGGGFRGGGASFHGGAVAAGGYAGYRAGGYAGGAPMDRPAPAARPAFQSSAVGSAVHGPYGGTFEAGRSAAAVSRPGEGGAGERHVWQTPGGGTIYGGGGNRSFTGPGGGAASGGRTAWAYTGPHGAVAIHGGKAGEITGPGGREIAGGKSGTAVIGPNGNVHATGSKGVEAKGPGGTAIAGSRGSVTSGPGGVVATGSRGGVATGPGGTAVAGRHGTVAVGPYGAVATGGRVVAGRNAGGFAYAGTRYVAASDLRGQGAYVRRSFGYYNAFTPAWYRRYPGAWVAAGWIAGSVWTAATWASCVSTVGYAESTPQYMYDYGDVVTYQDGNVYSSGEEIATEADYAQQATQIADAGQQARPAADEKWQPLGVFAMVKGDETTSDNIFQLAMNKDGVVRGNYYNALTNTAQPVYGSLDKKSQRVAWTVGDKKDTVFEAGLYNLTLEQTTMLAHFGKDRTEQYKLFRVEEQKEEKAG